MYPSMKFREVKNLKKKIEALKAAFPHTIPVFTGFTFLGIAYAVITRFLPFILFKDTKSNNSYISYLGQVLPYSAIGLLVVYCLKSVSFKSPALWIPEAIAIICITVLHY